MKNILICLLVLLIFVSLSGCTYKGYSGDHKNLYTVATNSVLWNNGHSFSADQYTDSKIEIIDEDIYGRIMFIYYEKYYAGGGISFSSLVICQHSNEEYVFYYEDVNYIVKEQQLYSPNFNAFEDKEIEQLKATNDWNREINFDKCIKKEISKHKSDIPCENEVKNLIVNEFHLDNKRYSLFVNFLTSNSDDSKFIVYGYITIHNEDSIYFIGLAENEHESLENINFLVPLSVYDYKTEFTQFKETHNWN